MTENCDDRIRLTLARSTGFALDVDLKIPSGGVTVLFGVSGCGKTTILRSAAGLERAQGYVRVAGQVWQDDEKKILIDIQNNIQCGDIVTRGNGIKYFIVAKQSSDECSDLIANRINTYIQVIRLEKQYEDYEVIGTKEVVVEENVPTYFKDVSASMRFYDAGLLKDTVKTILIKNTVDIKELDRIKLNNVNYQVDSIDEGRYENMYYVQLSEDTRAINNE